MNEISVLYAEAHRLCQEKDYVSAEKILKEILNRAPGNIPALILVGLTAYFLGEKEKAFEYFDESVRRGPANPQVFYNYAFVSENSGNIDAAMEYYEKALELKPDYAAALNNLANLLKSAGRLEEAEKKCRSCMEKMPFQPEIYNTTGNLLSVMGRNAEAVSSYRKALELKQMPSVHSNLLLALNYLDMDNETLFTEHRNWEKFNAGKLIVNRDFANALTKERKLRIGYISPDFRRHSVAYFFDPLIRHHNRERFEIYCYSDASKPDAVTGRIKSFSDKWRDVYGMNDEAVFAIMKNDVIDILVDLSGHTGQRLLLFARKPAPLQITYLGYPNTTGLSTMDYRITDSASDPAGLDKFYTEKLIRLKDTFLTFAPPAEAPEVSGSLAVKNGFITFGSFNNPAKISPGLIAAWAEILKKAPSSRLVMKNIYLGDAWLCRHISALFEARGIKPERLELLPFDGKFEEHLSQYSRIDVALDTFPYNGTTTTCEALWMGVPVICLAGNRHASRVGVSLLSSIGLKSFIAPNIQDYIKIAAFQSENIQLLANMRPALRNLLADSPLCRPVLFAADLENAYTDIWAKYIHENKKSS